MANRWIDPPVFDYARMKADVKAFRKRQKMTVGQFLDLAGIRNNSHARQQLSRQYRPSLETVVRWALAADLSLETYILPENLVREEQGI